MLTLPTHFPLAGCTVAPANVTCYVDTSDRILEPDQVASGDAISLEYCAQLCRQRGKALAGAENGNECYCGDALKGTPQKADGDCKTTCNGAVKEQCGGNWRISVYPVTCSGDPEPRPKQTPELINPACNDKASKFASQPWCDHTLPLDARVADMVSRLTLDEKICLQGTGGCPIDSLGLPPYNWWSGASSGVASGRDTQTTKFAFPITTGMSFNRSMWRLTGRQIGTEARAMMNAGNGYSTFWTPVINLAREPRWGRNIEVPGEVRPARVELAISWPRARSLPIRRSRVRISLQDPFHTGEYAQYFVTGFQEAPQDPSHLLASAGCKHYVANSMESTTDADGEHHDRSHVDSQISMQDLVDSYMLPFQACVEKGRVSSLMCSCAPRRPPAPTPPRALDTPRAFDTLRVLDNAAARASQTTQSTACLRAPTTGCSTLWLARTGVPPPPPCRTPSASLPRPPTPLLPRADFDGYITSDCDADNDVVFAHHYTKTPEEGVAAVLHAGTDVDCGGFVSKYAQSALDKKTITEADLDARLKMQFKVRVRLSHFDPPGPLDKIGDEVICSDDGLALSHDGMTQSAALLKNDKAALPLPQPKGGELFAVIGPNALLSKSDAGYYGAARLRPHATHLPPPPRARARPTSQHARAQARRTFAPATFGRSSMPWSRAPATGSTSRRWRACPTCSPATCPASRRRWRWPRRRTPSCSRSAPTCRGRPKGATPIRST